MPAKTEGQKHKLTLSIDPDLAKRFGAYSYLRNEDMSEIVTRLLRREMKGFVVRMPAQTDSDEETPTVPMDRRATG